MSTQTQTPDPAPLDDSKADPLQAAKSEAEDLRQKWLLAQADLQNARRRAAQDMEQERLYRSLPLARDLLPGLDNLRRALEAAAKSPDVGQLVQGVQMVVQQIENVFASHGIKPIEAVGQPFDPNLHQAIQQVPTADAPPGTVVQEFQKGYVLNDRIIRPATVVVAAAKE